MIVIRARLIFLMIIFRLSVYKKSRQRCSFMQYRSISDFPTIFRIRRWKCRAKNGAHSACKNCPDSGLQREEGKGGFTNKMEENDTGRDKKAGICWERTTGLVQDRAIWKNLIEASCATMDLWHNKI